jgi:hypothetical protein
MAARDRIPALLMVALLHGAAVFAFLNALIIERPPAKPSSDQRETQITLAREPPRPQPRKRRMPAAEGSGAITGPFFNPYTYHSAPTLPGTENSIALALSACDPARYDRSSREVRTLCDRIGLALKSDPGRFGFTSEVSDPQHWQRELARREAPYLAPCMTPNGPDALYALSCVYKLLFGGYDSETRPRYSQ